MVNKCERGSKSRIGGEPSEDLPVMTSLRLGDTLSLALFNVSLESAMRKVLIQSKGINIESNQ